MKTLTKMIKLYWSNISNAWDSYTPKKHLYVDKDLFWIVLNDKYNFNDCLLNKDYEYTFDFYDNEKIILTSVINTENKVKLNNLDLHMTSISIGIN